MSHFDYRPSYRRNLPHIQPPGATFFVTFHLAGSLPRDVIVQWNNERRWLEHVARDNPVHYQRVKADFERLWFAKFEVILAGAKDGPLWLNDERVAGIVADSLHYRDGKVYRLDAFSIMPNHVHTVFKPLSIIRDGSQKNLALIGADPSDLEYHSLAKIRQSLKGYTSYKTNRILGRQEEFWAHESYDHYVRDDEEWQRLIRYTVNNPVKAGYRKHWREWKWNYRRT
ncbi:MAG: hypothetical protein ABJB61_14860 [bacterium]